MTNRFATACRWLLVFCILLLHGFSYEQSPPEPSRSPRPSPRPPLPQLQPPPPLPEGFLQKFPLSLLSAALRLALCPLPERGGCVWQFSWVIDLPPFPLSSGAKSNSTGLHCIGTIGTGCRWQTITGYLAEESDTYAFAPLELHVQAQDISQMLMMGHTTFTGVLLRQLQVLSIACDNPHPVFAPYFLEPLIMALSAARVDAGVNVSAAVPAPPPPSPPGVSPSANYTSDAANASLASVGFSRLYAQPILASPQLRKLTINNCKLTGQLLRDTFWLQLPKLEHLDLSRNMLSGPLPATFGPSPPLSHMNLSYNRITGPLTSTHIRYGGCGRTLDLSYNDLRGGLPKQWLASACTLEGKDSVGLSPPRRRRLDEQVYDNWVGPEGGVKVADLRKNVRAATFKTSDSGHTGTSNETNLQASTDSGVDGAIAAFSSSTSGTTTSAAYAFWLSYPMSYSYGGDNCPSYGIAWDVPLASGVHNGTGGPDGIPFPFTVLLYGNPNLHYPGGKKAGYATAPSAYLHFSVRENACTAFDPLPEIVWLWGSFGVCTVVTVAISVIQALWVIRRIRAKVAPAGAAKGATSTAGAAGGTRKKAKVQEGERSTTRQGEASRPGKGQSATVTPSAAAGATGSGPSSTAPTNPPPTATVTVVPTSTPAVPPTTTTTANTTSGNDASASPAMDPVPTARPGSGSMARIIIVGHHARVYSRAAAMRLGVWGNAVLDVIEAFGEWFFLVIPWGHIIRTLVAFSVHVGASGLTYVMSLPQRTAYCTTVIDCLPYLFFVPIVLSLLSMAVTLFLMRATHMLAGSMTQQLCGSAAGGPSAWGAGPWQPLGQGPPRGGGPSPTATLSEEQSDKNSNGPAAGANNALQPAAAAEATLSEPERWISGLQPIRTVAATHRSPSLVGVAPNMVRASSQSKSTQGAAPPVAVALPTPRCLSNNSSTGTSGRSGGGGGAGSRNNNLSNLSGAAAASVAPAQRPDSPRAVAYVHGLGLGPPAGALAGPAAVVSSGPSTHLRPVAESIESGSGRVTGRQLSSRGVVAASRLTWQRHEPGVVAFDQEDGGWRSAGPAWSQRAHPANIIGRGGSGCGRGGSGGGGDEGPHIPHAGGCRSEPGAAREWESAGQLLPGRPGPVGEATEELEASAPAASGAAGTWPVLAREGTDTVTAPGADSRVRVSPGLMAPPPPTGLNTTGPNSVLEASAVLASSANSGIVMAPGAYPGATATWAGQMPAGPYSESNTNRMTPTVRAGGANPWLEDRLNALAVLTTSSMSLTAAAASPTPYADGTRRMPSNATAAAVAAAAAATPSWRRQPSPNNDTPSTSDTNTHAAAATHAVTSPAGGMAPEPLTSQTRLNNLRHEALGVVNKFLYEYALGSPSTPWWPGRVGCITRSLALVLLCAVPIAPFAAILIVLAFFAVVAETVVRKVGVWARCAVRVARSSASFSCSPRFAELRLTLALFLGVHTHVAAWVLGIPLAFFTGVCYGLGYMWGQDAVPYPWVFLACNAACLAGVLLLLLELGYDLHTWERGVCRYPYEVALRAAAVGPSGAGAQTQQRVVEA